MNLRLTLPEKEQSVIEPQLKGDRIIYCVPFDIDKNGNFWLTDGLWYLKNLFYTCKRQNWEQTDTITNRRNIMQCRD